MPERRVMVLWSGGVDSTCLIEHLLADASVDVVLAGYVYLHDQAAKAESELHAIERMSAILRARDSRFVWLGTILQIEFGKTNRNLAYKQVPPWLLAAVEAVHVEVEEIAIGYIKNTRPEKEDVTAHIDTLERIYQAYGPLMHGPLPRLTFPLLGLSKAEVLARISPELRALCVYCEAPIREEREGELAFRACGRCRTCRSRAASLTPPT